MKQWKKQTHFDLATGKSYDTYKKGSYKILALEKGCVLYKYEERLHYYDKIEDAMKYAEHFAGGFEKNKDGYNFIKDKETGDFVLRKHRMELKRLPDIFSAIVELAVLRKEIEPC